MKNKVREEAFRISSYIFIDTVKMSDTCVIPIPDKYVDYVEKSLLSFNQERIDELKCKCNHWIDKVNEYNTWTNELKVKIKSLEKKIEIAKENLKYIASDRLYSDCSMDETYGRKYERIAAEALKKLEEK